MTNDDLPLDKCLPVERYGDYFVIASGWLKANLPFPESSELRSVLSRPFSRETGNVLVDGRMLRAEIFSPKDETEEVYAILQPTLAATDVATDSHQILTQCARYFHSVQLRYSHSEALLPEQRCDISNEFLEPTFTKYLTASTQHLSWSQARRLERLLVIGTAGSGKTTLLRQWMLGLTREAEDADVSVIPVYFSLRRWEPTRTIDQEIRRELRHLEGEWAAENFKKLAEGGRLAIGFDGVDEIPTEHRADAGRGIRAFVDAYPRCRILVTTRSATIPDLQPGFTKLEVLPFTESQVRELVFHKLYGKVSWKQFWSRLYAERFLREIGGNPFIVTLIIARYLRREITPSYVTEVMTHIVDALIDHWDSSRGIVRSKLKVLSPDRKAKLLKTIAGHLAETGEGTFSVKDLTSKLHVVAPELAAAQALELLHEHTSLIQKTGPEQWSFRHRIFQDFFFAAHWMDRLTSKIEDLIGTWIGEKADFLTSRMRFLSGLSGDATGAFAYALEQAKGGQPEAALALAEAMTQKLVLEDSILAGYSYLVRSALEQLLRKAHSVETSSGETVGAENIWSLTVKFRPNERDQRWAETLTSLLDAIHRGREGSASTLLTEILRNADDKHIGHIGLLTGIEGRFVVRPGSECVIAAVEHESPNLPDEGAASG